MKKFFAAILLIFLISSMSYGAVSDDIYVRKDVFEVYMQNINSNIEKILAKVENLEKSVNELKTEVAVLSKRIDEFDVRLSTRMNGVEARMGDLRNDFYLLLVALGIFLGLPFFQKMYENRKSRVPQITLEDVKRLITEAQLNVKPQV